LHVLVVPFLEVYCKCTLTPVRYLKMLV
jgi:hypothetical protein